MSFRPGIDGSDRSMVNQIIPSYYVQINAQYKLDLELSQTSLGQQYMETKCPNGNFFQTFLLSKFRNQNVLIKEKIIFCVARGAPIFVYWHIIKFSEGSEYVLESQVIFIFGIIVRTAWAILIFAITWSLITAEKWHCQILICSVCNDPSGITDDQSKVRFAKC